MRGNDAEIHLSSKELGRLGEKMAEKFLREEKDYRILSRNYRCPLGEIDIVALDNDTVAFVEVRSSSAREVDLAAQSVNSRKQAKLRQLASFYLKAQNNDREPLCRFDVVLVFMTKSGIVREIRLLQNAF